MDSIPIYRRFNFEFSSYFQSQWSSWKINNQYDKSLIFFGCLFWCVALMFYLIGGHHTGFYALNEFGNTIAPSAFWSNVTFMGDTLVALTVVLFLCYRNPQLAFSTLIGALITTLLVHFLKHSLNLPRPPAVLEASSFYLIGPAYKSISFPSGHTATAFLMAALLTRCTTKGWQKLMLILAASLIGLSRVVCGVHWPIDVLVGAGTGLFSGYLALRLSDRWCVSTRVYTFVVMLLITAAILLMNHDGGLEKTHVTSHVLSAGGLICFFGCITFHILKKFNFIRGSLYAQSDGN